MQDKKLEDYSKEELISIIKSIKKQKKFGLVWEDKPEKVATDCKEKLPVLNEDASKAISKAPGQPTNIIIEGDNYHSLSALNYTHAGKIDIIYIDPPYNTGNKDFIYNDRIVDREDSYKHSKWLSFMQKRLELSRNLLSDTGVIFISIDDHEQARLKILCDEIFDEDNLLSEFVWKKKTSGGQGARYSLDFHEYVLCYAKNINNLDSFAIRRSDEQKKSFKLKDEYYETRGAYLLSPLQSWLDYRPNLIYPIEMPDGSIIDGIQWTHGKESFEELKKDGRIEFKKTKNGWSVYKKQYEKDKADGVIPPSILDMAQTSHGTKELKEIFGGEKVFPNPKPTRLIEAILEMTKNKNAIVLDYFAGSGTTAHAMLKLNTQDNGNRKFIICTNNENNIAEKITYERIKKVIEGYSNNPGIPANVRYFKTDFIEKEQTLDKLRRKLSPACEDMIRIREGIFNKIIDEDLFKAFEENGQIVGVIYDRFELEKYIDQIEKLETDNPVHLYVFSYDNSGRLDEVTKNTKHEYESQPIPEGVLEIYKKIFKDRRH